MKRISGPRQATNLSNSLQRQLNLYALAGAAGASGLLWPASAQAEIVYTAANQGIFDNHSYVLDLTNSGNADFTIHNRSMSSTSGHWASLYVTGAPGNTVEGNGRHFRLRSFFEAADLQAGALIPAKVPSKNEAMLAFHCSGFLSCSASSVNGGNWFGATSLYLGLKFVVQGQTHYGWARLSVHFSYPRLTAILTGYAYETLPNTPIFAGGVEPSQSGIAPLKTRTRRGPTLGALALGSQGRWLWRREETEA
jgi:hypothetical protein